MQDAELFIHSAEIAGVFVGFGALIAIRSGATMAASEINGGRVGPSRARLRAATPRERVKRPCRT